MHKDNSNKTKHCTDTETERQGGSEDTASLDVDRLGTWRHVASITHSSDAACCCCCRRCHHQHWLRLLVGRHDRWLAVLVLVLHVLWKGARVTERLEAMFTAEWLFSAVQTAVLGQVVLVLERLVTDRTDERPLTWHTNQHAHIAHWYTQLQRGAAQW